MKYLIASLIGAIIGYLTNWLAIKMLFRPYTEKRVLGVKIPFTPGLIPKEKSRIASSVGDTIGKHLLSKDSIIESLCSNEMNLKLRGWVENKVKSLINSNSTLEQEAKKIIGEKYDNLINFINKKIFNIIIEHINKEKVILSISKEIIILTKKQLKKNPKEILDSILYKEFKKSIMEKSKNALKSEEFNNFINSEIKRRIAKAEEQDCLLKDIIPKSLISTIQVCIYNNDEKVCKEIKALLNEEKVKEKIMSFISGMISSNVSPMIAMFLDPKMLSSKLISGMENYLGIEDNRKQIVIMINKTLDRMFENRVSKVIENFSEDVINTNIKSFATLISDRVLNERFIESTYEVFENKIIDEETFLNIIKDASLESSVLDLLNKNIKDIFNSQEVQENIKRIINDSIASLMSNKLCDTLQGKEEKIVNISCNIAEDIFKKFIENQASDVVETLNISKIVENKINEFDVAFAEQIILEIASKELSAITWLGGLLGAVMGILSPLLSSIY